MHCLHQARPCNLLEAITLVRISFACKADRAQLTCRADKKAVRQTISANSEPDLFWGMRGAGGSLGVAIEYSTYAFAVPENVRTTAAPALLRFEGANLAVHCAAANTASASRLIV